MQELKSSGGVLYSVQTTLPEAGGRVGEVPVAVSWEWLPGAPCGSSAAVRADLHVNLRGCTTPRTLSAARGVQWPLGLPGNKKKYSL